MLFRSQIATHRAAGLEPAFGLQYFAQLGSASEHQQKILKGVLNLLQSRFLFRMGDAQDAEQATRIAPYAALVFRTLQLIVPAAGAVTIASMPQAQQPVAQAYLQAMGTVLETLPSAAEQPGPDSGLTATSGQLTAAEGEALRALRAIIFEHDPLRAFGGLRRVQAPSGDLLWVCENHYPDYDPGLPVIR